MQVRNNCGYFLLYLVLVWLIAFPSCCEILRIGWRASGASKEGMASSGSDDNPSSPVIEDYASRSLNDSGAESTSEHVSEVPCCHKLQPGSSPTRDFGIDSSDDSSNKLIDIDSQSEPDSPPEPESPSEPDSLLSEPDSHRESPSQYESNSPASSPASSPAAKRRRYGLYKEDVSVPVPRETPRRWLLANAADDACHTGVDTAVLPLFQEDIGPVAESNSQVAVLPNFQQASVSSYYQSDLESEDSSNAVSENDDLNTSGSDGVSVLSSVGYDSDQDNNSTSSEDGSIADSDCGSSLLYPGCAKSADEAILSICNLYLKHRWTKASLNDNLKLFSSMLPEGNNMPSSLHLLYKHVNSSSAPCLDKPYYYCSKCLKLKTGESVACEECNTSNSGVFYYMSIADQIRYMFEHTKLADAIDEFKADCDRKTGQERDVLCDVVDSAQYKKNREHANGIYDIIMAFMMWNTDGVFLSKSSKVELYPVLSTVCEVAPRKRSMFTMVNSLWVDSSSPKMNEFLRPFAEELREMYESGGIEWKHPVTNVIYKSQVLAPLFIGDAPMRADVLALLRHNAMYACIKCEQKTVRVPRRERDKQTLRRFVFLEDPAIERTSHRMHLQGARAEEAKLKHVKGVKGGAIIAKIPRIDRAYSTVAEYMHSILLGVTFHFTFKWFFIPGPWSIKSCLKVVDDLLLSIKVPDFMRCPRKISEIKYFKASELRAWLLFFCLVILQSTNMHDNYYQHWILLVKSVFILLQAKITEDELNLAEAMLRSFVRNIGKLYSDHDYVYNVHQLIHLTTYVREWGPLFAYSAFLFENYNGILSRLVHGTKHQSKELVESLKLAHCIQVLRVKVHNAADDANDEVSLFGSLDLLVSDREFLRGQGISDYKAHSRALYKKIVYTTLFYDKNKKKCNSVVEFCQENKKLHGQIISFIKTSNDVYCLLELFKVCHVNIIFHRDSLKQVTHLCPVKESNKKVLIKMSSIVCKVLKVGQFIASEPNHVEINL